jgi:hypothetical protein
MNGSQEGLFMEGFVGGRLHSLGRICIGNTILTQTNFPINRPGVQVWNDLICCMV